MQSGKFNILVDLSWGSSGKGAVSTRLADIFTINNASSCNGANAGHTTIHNGQKFVFKVLPSPSSLLPFKGKKIKNWLGPTSGFFKNQLDKEIKMVGVNRDDLIIHERAIIADESHIQMEREGPFSTLHLSSTMSGAGASATCKAMRLKSVNLAGKLDKEQYNVVSNTDFPTMIRKELAAGNTFLHEVSQGFALSLNHGTHYPHCTSRDCTPQQAVNDMGIQFRDVGDIYANVRSFPIRVGNNYDEHGNMIGYSGDCMPDQEETTWAKIGQDAEMPQSEIDILAEKERTTVTKKIRRCYTMSWEYLKYSTQFVGGDYLVLNFPQYIHWSCHKARGGKEAFLKLHPKVRTFVDKMEETTKRQVVMISTGADHDDYIWVP
jgi:adenylosuccinate synthase